MNDVRMVCFDLNKTLIQENTWLDLNLAMGVTQQEDDILMSWAKDGIINDQQGQDILCGIYRSRGNATRENIEAIVRRYTYLEGAREAVGYCISKGYQVSIVSGAMDSLVEHVADQLGVRHWRAGSALQYDDNGIICRIEAAPSESRNKAEQLKELCAEIGVDISQTVVIGDGANDRDIFELSGRGVTFTGSALEDFAWRVIPNLTALNTVL